MINKKQILHLVEEKITGTANFLVDITVSTSNNIVVTIDNFNGVAIKDCVALSRHIENNLDREKEDFELTVTSPGIDEPFQVFNQYKKNEGKEVEVLKTNGEKVKGILIQVNETAISIEPKPIKSKAKKNKAAEILGTQEISFDNIKETKKVISFK